MENFDSSNPLHAKNAIREYKKNAGTAPDGKSNTRAVWFSIEQLKSLLERLERERVYTYAVASEGDRLTGNGIIDGIRVYFATYPAGYNYVNDYDGYEGRNTVFLVSTKGGEDHSHVDEFEKQGQLEGYSKFFGSKSVDFMLPPENTGELAPPKIKGIDEDLLPFD